MFQPQQRPLSLRVHTIVAGPNLVKFEGPTTQDKAITRAENLHASHPNWRLRVFLGEPANNKVVWDSEDEI